MREKIVWIDNDNISIWICLCEYQQSTVCCWEQKPRSKSTSKKAEYVQNAQKKTSSTRFFFFCSNCAHRRHSTGNFLPPAALSREGESWREMVGGVYGERERKRERERESEFGRKWASEGESGRESPTAIAVATSAERIVETAGERYCWEKSHMFCFDGGGGRTPPLPLQKICFYYICKITNFTCTSFFSVYRICVYTNIRSFCDGPHFFCPC